VKIKNLTKEISEIYERIVDGETSADLLTAKVHPSYRLSAKNLYRYLILRNFDLRKYHDSLSDIGVSSLRSSEGYVFNNLHNVIRNLKLIQGINTPKETGFEVVGYKRGKHLLQRHTRLLFNDKQLGHYTEIMVTLPSEAATNKLLIEKMVAKGMDVARINLSHDNEQTWTAMVRHLKEIEATTGKRTAIFMDLTGPKIRTGKITRTSKKGKNRDYLKIKKGNNLVLVKAEREIDPELQQSPHLAKNKVPVQLPKIIDALQIGEPVYFDDGMIKTVVTEKSVDSVTVQIQEAYKTRLGSEKGINIPSTKLNLPSLTKRDLALLPFAIKHADIIGYSFVRTPEDVASLYRHLDNLGANDVGVVFKIENQEAFENLPLILLEGMKRERIGVMIARGDLAVELGFERTSEVQNQILWLCEAAHVPVIWATQVLESLVKTGMATRAEISDAGLSTQAECVMLNKGPYIAEGIETLKHILIKMHAHYSKKKDSLRTLHIAVQALDKLEKSI
jgi:pyruvate kinase